MKKTLLLPLVFLAGLFGSEEAKAVTPCNNTPPTYHPGSTALCYHWKDGNRSSQTQIPLRFFGNWGSAIGFDSTSFRYAITGSNTGVISSPCTVPPNGPPWGTAWCGELTTVDVVAPTANWTSQSCPIGTPITPVNTGVRAINICITHIGPTSAPDAANWTCFGVTVDLWVGCAMFYSSWEWDGSQWQQSPHISTANIWIDTSVYLQTNGAPNYNYPYYYGSATKNEVACHEINHALGGGHTPDVADCTKAIQCDFGNPNSACQDNKQRLYGSAVPISSWHNHSDPGAPDAMLTATAKPQRTVTLKMFAKPRGLPKPGITYVSATTPEAFLTASLR